MGINSIKVGLLITAAQFLLSGNCNKEDTGCISTNNTYNFDITSEWNPQQDIYIVGDTIFLTSNIAKQLIDKTSNNVVEYSNSTGIIGDITINYLDTITRNAKPAKDSFSFVSIKGNFLERDINKDLGINFSYVETGIDYQFKGAVICRKKGIYGFGVANCLSRGLRGKNCTKAGFDMTVSNTDKHLYLHQYALNVNPNDTYLQQKGYDFRVQ